MELLIAFLLYGTPKFDAYCQNLYFTPASKEKEIQYICEDVWENTF